MSKIRHDESSFCVPSLYTLCLEFIISHFDDETTDLSTLDEDSCILIAIALNMRMKLTAAAVTRLRDLGHSRLNELLKPFDTRLAVAGSWTMD